MGIAEMFLRDIKAQEILAHEAPGLYKAMEEVATKLKIPMPKFHLMPEILTFNPLVDGIVNQPNAMSLSRTDIAFSKPLLELFESTDLTKPISQELKAVLAHEMHHSANQGSMMMMAKLPVFALPLIAVVGTFIYDRAHAKAKKDGDTSPQNVVKHVEAATKEAEQKLPAASKDSNFFKNVVYYGKYFAIAAAAFGTSLFVARFGARYHEFAADVFGAGSVVDKEIMVSALRKVHSSIGASVSEDVNEARKISEVIGEYILAPLAHPTFAERAAHIRGR